jgi:hypothetical protein
VTIDNQGKKEVVVELGMIGLVRMGANDEAVPAPALTTALFERFFSRGEAGFANKLLSAMRVQFGGHYEKAAGK